MSRPTGWTSKTEWDVDKVRALLSTSLMGQMETDGTGKLWCGDKPVLEFFTTNLAERTLIHESKAIIRSLLRQLDNAQLNMEKILR